MEGNKDERFLWGFDTDCMHASIVVVRSTVHGLIGCRPYVIPCMIAVLKIRHGKHNSDRSSRARSAVIQCRAPPSIGDADVSSGRSIIARSARTAEHSPRESPQGTSIVSRHSFLHDDTHAVENSHMFLVLSIVFI
jgi:hypothetical protein